MHIHMYNPVTTPALCPPPHPGKGQRDRRACPGVSGFADLQQVVGGVVQSHDESPRPDVVGKPGEADENDGGYVMDDLLLEILWEIGSSRALIPDLSLRCSHFLQLTSI